MTNFDIASDLLELIKSSIRNKHFSATEYVTYRSVLNPKLSMPNVYYSEYYIPDLACTALTSSDKELKVRGITSSEVPKYLDQLNRNKSNGPDNLAPRFLRG